MGRLSDSLSSLRASGPIRIFFDIGPLLDTEWTGIPVVAAKLAGVLLEAAPSEVVFFHDSSVAPMESVAKALAGGGGWGLSNELSGISQNVRNLDPLCASVTTIGLFPTVKTVRRVFDVECSIVHDISTIVTPQYHLPGNIALHAQTLQRDIEGNDLTICVSNATRDDIVAYLGYAQEKFSIAFNGVSWPADFELRAENEIDWTQVEPYFLVLGTREPRKNLARVFELLSRYSHLLDHYRFVITGRAGWMEGDSQPEALADALTSGRLVFTGFVNEYQKYKLLLGATAMIYPSLLEGFGLPVLESLSVGTPCITSHSSSLREVGGDVCGYFDPFSVRELHGAVKNIQAMHATDRAGLRERCRQRAALFTWENMAADVLEALAPSVRAAKARYSQERRP